MLVSDLKHSDLGKQVSLPVQSEHMNTTLTGKLESVEFNVWAYPATVGYNVTVSGNHMNGLSPDQEINFKENTK